MAPCFRNPLSLRSLGGKVSRGFTAFTLASGLLAAAPLHSFAQKAVVAYVFPQDRALSADEIAAGKVTRINYAFANIRDGRIVNGFKNDDQNFATLDRKSVV